MRVRHISLIAILIVSACVSWAGALELKTLTSDDKEGLWTYRFGHCHIQMLRGRRGEISLTVGSSATTYPSRSFSMMDRGTLSVDDDYTGRGGLGERLYFLFPRVGSPDFEVRENQLELTTTSGDLVHVGCDRDQPYLTSAPESKITLRDSRIIAPAKRGVELQTRGKLLVLDAGFAIGGGPEARINATSTFHDFAGHSCAVGNRELFDYRNREYSNSANPAFRFLTDDSLAKFLSQRCPKIDVSGLIGKRCFVKNSSEKLGKLIERVTAHPQNLTGSEAGRSCQ